MKEKSLTNTNSWIKRDPSNGRLLDRNIASNTAIETSQSVKDLSAQVLNLRVGNSVKPTKKSS
jgi:hypothetical protein